MSNIRISTSVHYFDEASKTWDQDPLVFELAKAAASSLLAHVVFRQEHIVMEYGCGSGLISEVIAPRVRHLHAWDSSPGMLSTLESKLQQHSISGISTRQIDLTCDEVPDHKFDIIYSSMALHHVKDTEGLFEKFRKLLAPGGCIALIDLDTEDGSFHGDIPGVHHNGFERDTIERQLANLGFSHIDRRTAYCFEKTDEDGLTNQYSLFLICGHVTP